jgi:asparagine synthetase B (glutamine-hydrolysing)
MCGIGGFSLSNKSKLNARTLSNALLAELDVRGGEASGYAVQTKDSTIVFKKNVAGAKLNLKRMPKNARVGILHTRLATHGSPKDNANNHPVMSPDQSISLVHNGVIYNHKLVRTELQTKLPEVDSSVIPAILEKYGRDITQLSMLDGDASVAWLDDNDKGTLRVARISHSPLTIAQLKDGSFVFASTEQILNRALARLGLRAEFITQSTERKLFEVRAGRIDSMLDLPETDPQFIDKSWSSSYGYYRNLTSGGHGYSESYEQSKIISSIWGDIYINSDWDYDPEEFGYDELPTVEGLFWNEYGEYFSLEGEYVGTIYDLMEMGIVREDGSTIPYNELSRLW